MTTMLIKPIMGGTPDDAVAAQQVTEEVARECQIAAGAIRAAAQTQNIPETVVTEMVGQGIVNTAARVTASRRATG